MCPPQYARETHPLPVEGGWGRGGGGEWREKGEEQGGGREGRERGGGEKWRGGDVVGKGGGETLWDLGDGREGRTRGHDGERGGKGRTGPDQVHSMCARWTIVNGGMCSP